MVNEPTHAGEIGLLVDEYVLTPWEEACTDAPKPWEAPAPLLADWRRGCASSNPCRALASAIGLQRTSSATWQDAGLCTQVFAESGPKVDVSEVMLADVILQGARPAAAIVAAIVRIFTEEPSTRRMALVCESFRHPGLDLSPGVIPWPVGFFSGLRDRSNMPVDQLGNEWTRAAVTTLWETELLPASRLSHIAAVLCCRMSALELRQMLLDPAFAGAWADDFSEHPVLKNGPRPEFIPNNPTAQAIAYFSGANLTCAAWRAFNPLLKLPWQVDLPVIPATTQAACAMGVLGYPLALIEGMWPLLKSEPDRDWRVILASHPSFALLGYLAKHECKYERDPKQFVADFADLGASFPVATLPD